MEKIVNIDNINDNYYKAYEERYKQVYDYGYLWSSKDATPDVIKIIEKYNLSKNLTILELGCGEGRDSIFLLDKGYNVLAVDYSKTVIDKCNELSNYKYKDSFSQFDIIKDKMSKKFDFIYSIAVIHMFVNKTHRDKFYNFIYEHLNDNGIALIETMGDGYKNYESDISKSFDNSERVISCNNQIVNIAATSCKIVDWDTLEKELIENNLIIREKWISKDNPEFDSVMCVVVCKKRY